MSRLCICEMIAAHDSVERRASAEFECVSGSIHHAGMAAACEDYDSLAYKRESAIGSFHTSLKQYL